MYWTIPFHQYMLCVVKMVRNCFEKYFDFSHFELQDERSQVLTTTGLIIAVIDLLRNVFPPSFELMFLSALFSTTQFRRVLLICIRCKNTKVL